MCKECGCGLNKEGLNKESLEVLEDLMKYNKNYACYNRECFKKYGIYAINLMSAPGAGKTTLLEKTIELLSGKYRLGVIEGDLETERDAERIRKKGIPVQQITTGSACHLDAILVYKAMHKLPLENIDILFIENIGNLVCPSQYELGNHLNVTLLSVPEGDDKPEKYPLIFKISDITLITKIDLLPYFDFNLKKIKEDLKRINPKIKIIALSVKTQEGMEEWISFLEEAYKTFKENLIKNKEVYEI